MNSCLGEIVEEQEVIDFLQLHIHNTIDHAYCISYPRAHWYDKCLEIFHDNVVVSLYDFLICAMA